jgi:hypothetical protein
MRLGAKPGLKMGAMAILMAAAFLRADNHQPSLAAHFQNVTIGDVKHLSDASNNGFSCSEMNNENPLDDDRPDGLFARASRPPFFDPGDRLTMASRCRAPFARTGQITAGSLAARPPPSSY